MGCSSRKPDAVVVDHEGLLGCGFNHCICSPRKPGQDEPIFEGQIVHWACASTSSRSLRNILDGLPKCPHIHLAKQAEKAVAYRCRNIA